MNHRSIHDATGTTHWWTLLIGPIFVLLAVAFLIDPSPEAIPEAATPQFDRTVLSGAPMRTPLGDPPRVKLGGYVRVCMDCHRIRMIGRNSDQGAPLMQHRDITLAHGMNDRCFNCHDRANRDRLWIVGTKTVGYDQSHQLCAKCHGPTYQDWRLGMHGRTVGSWDTRGALPTRLTCVQCHDPHRPAFPDIAPLPGPNTLRMGPQGEHHRDTENPLLKWQTAPGPEVKPRFYGPQYHHEGARDDH